MRHFLLIVASCFALYSTVQTQPIWTFNSQATGVTGFQKSWDSDLTGSKLFSGPGLDTILWASDPSNSSNGVMALLFHWDSIGQHGRMEFGTAGNTNFLTPGGAKYITFWMYLDSAQHIPDSLRLDVYGMDNTNWTWNSNVHFVKDLPHNMWFPMPFAFDAHKFKQQNFAYQNGFVSGIESYPHHSSSVGWQGKIYIDNISLVDTFTMANWKWFDARSGPTSLGGIGLYHTGVRVAIGDSIHIRAIGSWWCGAPDVPWQGPEGGTGKGSSSLTPILPNISYAALVGGIGRTANEQFRTPLASADTGDYGPGYIGREYSGIAADSGNIFLALNDGPLDDNQGLLFLKIDIVKRPVLSAPHVHEDLPAAYRLDQNYPNPFNPSTTISYFLPSDIYASLTLYDLLGRKVRTLFEGYERAGSHSVSLNGNGLSSGVYFYVLLAGGNSITRSMLLSK